MNGASNQETAGAAPPPVDRTRPLYWSVMRELWENRSIVLGPLVVAGVVLFGFLISLFTLRSRIGALAALSTAKQQHVISMPFSYAVGLLTVTAFFLGAFYCLDALHGERRDRSILFWKSLPVSDRTAVLAKASVPLVLLPVLVILIVFAVHVTILLLSSAVLLGSGGGLALFWARLPIVQMWVAIGYALVAIALWHAPIYAWLLFVSGWARRTPVLWALLPFAAISALEKVAFGTTYFGSFVKHRLLGWFTEGFGYAMKSESLEPLDAMTPLRFFGMPGLWIGLVVAAALLAAAVRMRRDREPI
jgi:ABC-2 type transport system permease protein